MSLEKLLKYEPPVIGLDIREDFIEAAYLKKNKTGYFLDKFCSIPTPEKTIENGIIINSDKLADTLKELWKKNKIKSKHVAVALRIADLLIKIESYSYLKKEVLLDVIETKIKKYKAFTDEEPIIFTTKIGEELIGSEKKQKILITAAKKRSIDPLIKVLQKANLIIVFLTTPFFAAINALEDNSLKSEETEYKFFIELSEKQTFLAILKGGVVNFLSSINYGTKDYITSQESQDHLIESIKKIITGNNLEAEIDKLVIDYCAPEMDKILLRLIKNLKKPIEKGIGIIKMEDLKKDNGNINMVCIGLAKYETLKINLLPKEVAVASEWYKYFYYLVYIVIFVFIMMIIIFISINMYNYLLTKQLNYVKNRLDNLAIDYIQAKDLKAKTSEATEILKGRREILKDLGYFYWDNILQELSKLIPDNARLSLIDNRSNKIVLIEGEAKTPTEIFVFINNLKTANYFLNVRLDEVQHEKARNLFIFKIYSEESIKGMLTE